MSRLKLAAIFLSLTVSIPSFSAEEGKLAPDFQAKLIDGRKFSLGAVTGQVVIVHFWAS